MNIKTVFISIALTLLLVSCGSKAVEMPSVDMYAPGSEVVPRRWQLLHFLPPPNLLSDYDEANRGIGAMPPPPVARPSRNAW